ncbi:uncharacterized protein LOC104681257 isoform X2 [Rhinopithecus roxellana]|uniref:uncharacterized protein LOC104681257 isoform X2 n=1 Tax=Rhinopithecus roxellana TaxID=61622 RepID=UPI001237259E|nr:uncharacterized protein LOC104681257 isoform X2 [Rhinopithecus roxellana]
MTQGSPGHSSAATGPSLRSWARPGTITELCRFQQKMRNIPRRLAGNMQQPLFSCSSLMRALKVTSAGDPDQLCSYSQNQVLFIAMRGAPWRHETSISIC